MWRSSLQSETVTSTMQYEVIAFAACCRVLIPIIDMVNEIGSAIGLSTSEKTEMHVSIHEDNTGYIALAKKLPPECTTASKHYAIKTYWFRETCILLGVSILKIDTK